MDSREWPRQDGLAALVAPPIYDRLSSNLRPSGDTVRLSSVRLVGVGRSRRYWGFLL
jgi:hypothetical protein